MPSTADNNNNHPKDFWDEPLNDLLKRLDASPTGLTTAEAQIRLRKFGPNTLAKNGHFSVLGEFGRLFLNPLVIILILASLVSFTVGEKVGSIIIISMVFLSILLNFYQEYQAKTAVEALRRQVARTAVVIRDGKDQELPVAELVPGDIIKLNAGSLVPADARLFEEKDLHVRESALTGESLPVEKEVMELAEGTHGVNDAVNSVFLGTTVQSGLATALVVSTGRDTAFGAIASRLMERPPETEFDHGIKHFSLLITRVIVLLVLFVFLVNVAFKRPLLESFLFAVALAVGLTPELLPVIMSVTLSQGAKRMARKKVIVKQLASMENFGSIDVLCSDKTGTLTVGEIILQQHVNVLGEEDQRVLLMAYINSKLEAGVKNPMDDAILSHGCSDCEGYTKLDEIPFDFDRRRLSVVVKKEDKPLLITKGAVENVFDVCSTVDLHGKIEPFDADHRGKAEAVYQKLSLDGYRVIGVAVKDVPEQPTYTGSEEKDMTLIGFAAFLDPPKEGVGKTLDALHKDGISILIMTGDNEFITQKIAKDVGLKFEKVLVGTEVDAMDDDALAYQALHGAMFARVSPEQKNRVIVALKRHGRVVGFLGDGINDAPSMHTADIGISVVNAVDVAKEAANIILLEKDLQVLHDGVLEGRKSFANIMKYIIMGTSSNFGNMFSMAAASLFLPFLPMLPTQILLNNFLYDASQITIPSDNVDPNMLHRPRKWRIDYIRKFMLIIGPISSVYDFATFGLLLWVFKAGERLFHTGWFVESLATQTLVIFIIRTAGNPLKSRPSRPLLATVISMVVVATVIPYTLLGRWFGFVPMPPALLAAIYGLAITYLAIVHFVKTWFYKKNALI